MGPKHWWHYVEAESDSISINCWFDLDCDIFNRSKEIISSIHINIYMNNLKLRDEWMLKLFHLNSSVQKQIANFAEQRQKRQDGLSVKNDEAIDFKCFTCSCDPSQS